MPLRLGRHSAQVSEANSPLPIGRGPPAEILIVSPSPRPSPRGERGPALALPVTRTSERAPDHSSQQPAAGEIAHQMTGAEAPRLAVVGVAHAIDQAAQLG